MDMQEIHRLARGYNPGKIQCERCTAHPEYERIRLTRAFFFREVLLTTTDTRDP